jgi:hypothetical protein
MKYKARILKPTIVPDGWYSGKWSGYELEFELNGEPCFATLKKRGVRGINIPVRFRVFCGTVDEDSIAVEGKGE